MKGRNLKIRYYLKTPICIIIAIIICFIFPFSYCSAQYSVSEQNDSRIKFRQIETKTFHIVYPDYYETKAQKMAQILDSVVPNIGSSLGVNAPKIPILIHTKSSKSNGLTVWAPKRMEFWTTSPPSSYPFPYSWQLALHEYRHAAQMEAINTGATKFLTNVFGEHIIGAIAGIWVPNWFFEGDAVVAETAMAPTGRGQTPEYNMYLKALILSKGRFSTDKMLLGSMKDFVPNYYNLGYFLVSYARNVYGTNIWGKCLNHLGKNWFKFSPWGKTDDKTQNLDFKSMYYSAIDSLEHNWIDDDIKYVKGYTYTQKQQWGDKFDLAYTSYKNPVQINDSTIIALKTCKYQTQSLVKIVGDKEERIMFLPYLLNDYFDYKDGKILYSQYSPNIRWGQEDFADIMEYDLYSEKFKTLSSNATLFTPIYHAEDSLIAAVITDSLDDQRIIIISPSAIARKNRQPWKPNKSLINDTIFPPVGTALSYPVWSGEYIYAIETSAKGKKISRYNISSKERNIIFDSKYDDIKELKIHNNRLYFIKDIEGKYQVVSIYPSVEAHPPLIMHSNARYGVDSYNFYDSLLILSAYSANGYKIISTQDFNKPIQNTSSPEMFYTSSNRKGENFMLTESIIDTTKHFESKKYLKSTHLFNFHSWAPLYINIASQELGLGISAFSQNLLSTSIFEGGYKVLLHDKNELYFNYTYSGLYPIIKTKVSFRPRETLSFMDSNTIEYYNYDETTLGINLTIPFHWTNRNYTNYVGGTFYYDIHNISNESNNIRLTVFNSLGYEVNISNYAAMAVNDIYPRTGHITKIKYMHTLSGEFSHIFAVNSQVFFPGIARSNVWMITLGLQKNTPSTYYFPNEISMVRGVYDKFPKLYYGFMATYNFPLAYPDNGIEGIVYLKRIVAKPFFNAGVYDKEWYKSYGTDVLAKIHIFRLTIPVEIGFRIGYQAEEESTFASFLFEIDT